jgi:hypothetical protein
MDHKLTARQSNLYKMASTGPVRVNGLDLRSARQLQDKGLGKVCSNPGRAYSGSRIELWDTRGGYFVRSDWTWNPETSSFEKELMK